MATDTEVRAIQIIIGPCCTFFFLALALYRAQLGSVGSTLTRPKSDSDQGETVALRAQSVSRYEAEAFWSGMD